MTIINHWINPRPKCTLCGETLSPPYLNWRADTELNFCAECCAISAEGMMKDLIVMKAQYQISKISVYGWNVVEHKVEKPKTEKEWFDDLHKERDRKMNVADFPASKGKT